MNKYSDLVIFTTLAILFLSCQNTAQIQESCTVIPAPQETIIGKGFFPMKKARLITATEAMLPEAEQLQKAIAGETGITIPVTTDSKFPHKGVIVLEAVSGKDEEAYELNISKNNILLQASSAAGMFYAGQSLLQLIDSEGRIPCMKISDEPRFAWRGFLLDEDNCFFGKETVKQYIDIMARLKMNRFHWAVTGGTAWRFQIRRYPELTEGRPFYSQEDIREVVDYAKKRHVEVIPGINMPGHSGTITRAYPELSGGGNGFTVNPAKEETYDFINNVLKELTEMFPAKHIQIGGDEVHFGNESWRTDPLIRQFIKKNHLGDEKGLEHYFIRRYCEAAFKHGYIPLGWDEITKVGVPVNDVIVMFWRSVEQETLNHLISNGNRIILASDNPLYLDFVQDGSHKVGRDQNSPNTLDLIYDYPESSVYLQAIKEHPDRFPGIEACMWTNWPGVERDDRGATGISKQQLEFMTFPRLIAIAETGWTNTERKNKADFDRRLKIFMQYLDRKNIYYYNPFDPDSTPWP
ncbi:MAG: beta-N-acetylhexosaminidase [Tannerella sp.]|jgi:hexosaminidase|nr:beta-N-acetylhexosaminidase [Tannerella sp.]